jgi:hypothetical protein
MGNTFMFEFCICSLIVYKKFSIFHVVKCIVLLNSMPTYHNHVKYNTSGEVF